MNFLFGISGRIGRLQWWGGQAIIISLLIAMFIFVGETLPDSLANATQGQQLSSFGVIIAIVVLCIWMNIAVTVKRYHDRNKSGWWFFCGLIPFIGGIWQMVECGFLSGTPGGNEYGPPSGAGAGGGAGGLDAEIAAMKGGQAELKTSPFAFLKGVGEKKAIPVARQSAPIAKPGTTRLNGKPIFGQRGV